MSRQSEAKRLNANVITHGQESADWVSWARGEILALQAQVEQLEQRLDDLSVAEQGEIEASRKAARAYAQVEQLKGELSESDGDWVGIAAAQAKRAKASEKREAALRELLDELWAKPHRAEEIATRYRSLSEQSESDDG